MTLEDALKKTYERVYGYSIRKRRWEISSRGFYKWLCEENEKTPTEEIRLAKVRRTDFIERMG